MGESRERLITFLEKQGIELEFNKRIAPAMGISYGGRIALLPGQSKAEEFSTLVHELAHEMLHKAERRTTTTKVVRETEAEAIAFYSRHTPSKESKDEKTNDMALRLHLSFSHPFRFHALCLLRHFRPRDPYLLPPCRLHWRHPEQSRIPRSRELT